MTTTPDPLLWLLAQEKLTREEVWSQFGYRAAMGPSGNHMVERALDAYRAAVAAVERARVGEEAAAKADAFLKPIGGADELEWKVMLGVMLNERRGWRERALRAEAAGAGEERPA